MEQRTIPSLSVVIPSRDGRGLLADCLPPVFADLPDDAEVIVVDDGSTDGTADWLRAAFPNVVVIQLPGGSGFAAACNAGARAAQAPVIVFLNNDTQVQPGWSRGLMAAFDADEDQSLAIVGSVALFQERPTIVNSAGVRVAATTAAADIGLGLPRTSLDLRSGPVAGVGGVSLAVRTDWFAQGGGFDERLFMYFEDVELCLRAWMDGRRVWLASDSVVLHRGSASAGSRYEPLRNYYGSRNRLRVAASVLSTGQLVWAIPLLLAQDVATVLWLMLGRQRSSAVATARDRGRGAVAGLAAFPALRREFRSLAATRPRTFRDLQTLGLVTTMRSSIAEFVRLRWRERAEA